MITFNWREHNSQLRSYFPSDAHLAKCMFEVSKQSNYHQSLVHYEDFCRKIFSKQVGDFFYATFLHVACFQNQTELLGFLNVNILSCDAEIDFICVDPAQRNKGIAQALLKQFELTFQSDPSFIKNQSKIFLEVGADNQNAISLYEKQGFHSVSVRKKYYKNKEDAILMEKKVT